MFSNVMTMTRALLRLNGFSGTESTRARILLDTDEGECFVRRFYSSPTFLRVDLLIEIN